MIEEKFCNLEALCWFVSGLYHSGAHQWKKEYDLWQSFSSQETKPDEFSGSKLAWFSIMNVMQTSLQANTVAAYNEHAWSMGHEVRL